jgi:hypothetical protein
VVTGGARQGRGDVAGAKVVGGDERGQRQHGPAADRRAVGGGGEDGLEAAVIADRAEGGDCRLAHERIGRLAGQRDERRELALADPLVLAAGPRRDLDDRLIPVVERAEEVDRGVAGGDGDGAAAHGRIRIVEGGPQPVVVEGAEALERTQRGGPHVGVVGAEPGLRCRHVAGVAGEGDGAAVDHRFSRSVSVTTSHARPKAVTVATRAPITTASPPLATAAQTRRSGPAA